jgi:hypothetical protein
MSNGKLRVTPATVTAFTIAFLATDYLLYRMKSEYINSLIWKRVLGDNTGTATDKPGDSR